MERVENEHLEVPDTHQQMRDERVAGDKRAHEHIEEVEDELRAAVARLETKVDHLRYTVMGAAAAIVGAASWLIYAAN
jgi:hypothetical protein